MSQNPQHIIDRSPMGRLQYIVIALCIVLLALDGFDVLAISFAAPGIAREWGIDRGLLGIVLSMELAGMALGSMAIGGLADRLGRRPIILACLLIMTGGMLLAGYADSIVSLSIIRFATGLGIGGMLAAVNAIAAEYSNMRRRSACVSLMAAGYPLGVIIGGAIASVLLARFDWRAVFHFGAAYTALLIPLAWYLLPESVSFLLQRQPAGALQRINATLTRMGHDTIAELPARPVTPQRAGWAELFAPGLAATTVLLTLAYLAHIMTFYFILKWIPKIVVDMGYTAAYAGSVLVWANVGGLAGSMLLSALTQRFNVRTGGGGDVVLGGYGQRLRPGPARPGRAGPGSGQRRLFYQCGGGGPVCNIRPGISHQGARRGYGFRDRYRSRRRGARSRPRRLFVRKRAGAGYRGFCDGARLAGGGAAAIA